MNVDYLSKLTIAILFAIGSLYPFVYFFYFMPFDLTDFSISLV